MYFSNYSILTKLRGQIFEIDYCWFSTLEKRFWFKLSIASSSFLSHIKKNFNEFVGSCTLYFTNAQNKKADPIFFGLRGTVYSYFPIRMENLIQYV